MKAGRKRAFILSAAMVLLLGGCSGNPKEPEGQTAGTEEAALTSEYHFLEEESGKAGESKEPSVSTAPSGEKPEDGMEGTEIIWGARVSWTDNAMDDYQAVIRNELKKETAEGERQVTGVRFLGEGGCIRQGNHVFSSYKKDWSGVNGITTDGDEFSKRLTVETERIGAQIRILGPISGKNGYVACYYDYKDGKPCDHCFYELDESFQLVKSVTADLPEANQSVQEIMGDAAGNYHLILNDSGTTRPYLIISPEGEKIFEGKVSLISDLKPFVDGRIVVSELLMESNERKFSEGDLKAGTLTELAFSKDDDVKERMQSPAFLDALPLDEDRMAFFERDGISFYNLRTKEKRTAYLWSNHGMIPSRLLDVMVLKDGALAVLYEDENLEGQIYLLLRPTGEKVELKSITIAVRPENKAYYDVAAAYFKMKYPSYVINVKEDYDQTNLLTQLGAGDGPVLIDTSLTGFEELKTLWQPLDGFLEQAGLAKEMIPETLEFGKIDGVTYGITRDFRIDVLLTSKDGPEDWDYEGFLNALEGFDGSAFTRRDITAPSDWREVFFEVLSTGVKDNYYFDAETGNTIFSTPKFERVLKLAEKARKCPPARDGAAIREGEALCELTEVFNVFTAIRLFRRLEANDERILGYPTKDGARVLLMPRAPLALRATATEEEKTIAYTFLKIYLSKEVAAEGSFFSVRKDLLEEAFQEYQETVNLEKEYDTYDPNVMPEIHWDSDVAAVNELLRRGVTRKAFPDGLQKIFDDELKEYLEGRIGGKALADHLQNRVWLYLEEIR